MKHRLMISILTQTNQKHLKKITKSDQILTVSNKRLMLSELVNYLVATQAHVEQVEVFCSLRGETRPDGHRGHAAQRAEVKGQRAVVLRVGEGAVAVASRVFLTETQTHELSPCSISDT